MESNEPEPPTTRSNRSVVLAAIAGALVVLLVAGGIYLLTQKSGPSPVERVTIHGTLTGIQITSNLGTGGTIGGAPGACIPPTVGGQQVTVENSAGHVIGTTTSANQTTSTYHKSSGIIDLVGCKSAATYSVSVPKTAFYQLKVEGAAEPKTVSYQTLVQQGFVVNISFGITA